ncbi:UvrABC system protein C [Aquicella siphonis]|uniref:UvrABC system protein C n=1 Tax=Aquicella siphonis TaxID=254247 RepID=A0A5E4PFU4_9COXI|nr:excinuclease ABC subunit UvrC [Aquicella siphonis]VVC75870.1 UvrABC system protein C [Aquicella siphonis]
MIKNIKTFLANLSHHPGVYQMLGDKGEVLYVGKAKDLKRRVSSYFGGKSKDPKTLSLVEHIHDINITITHTENEAVLLECNLIKKHRPRYNVLLRDDKSYPYILISHHGYPRIDVYRGARKKNALYFGPYPSSLAVRETISLIQKIFRIRTCRDSYFNARTRPCLLYQIGRCSGPCVKLISEADYAHYVQLAILFLEGKSHQVIEELQCRMETAAHALDYELAGFYRDQITRLRQIQDRQYVNVTHGNADVIGFAMQAGIVCLQLLSIRGGQVLDSRSYFPAVPAYSHTDEIIEAFLTQHYLADASHVESIPRLIVVDAQILEQKLLENVLAEQAGHKVEVLKPSRGEKKKWLAMATLSARQSLSAHIYNKTNLQERVLALQAALNLKNPPRRIECFDISHTMGEATVAACVVFDQNGPVKCDYRRFNIHDIQPGDDIAAMRQALTRRFKRLQKEHALLPDLVLIDGGQAQLAAAKDILADLQIHSLLLVGVSKGPDRKPGFETLHIDGLPPVRWPADAPALHFIQQIRDEAHRFAITGHRQRRDKTRRQSPLERLPGIGAKRRRDLLRYFGGIQGIAHASLDELTKVSGISRSLAERIFAAFHDTTV